MLAAANIPKTIASVIIPYLNSRVVYLLLLMQVLLFLVGCYMEIWYSYCNLCADSRLIGISMVNQQMHRESYSAIFA
ncbi:MAG: hypothetical protein ACLTLQ_03420 [[Clostridium] scindens]